jgi:hypothetical protein
LGGNPRIASAAKEPEALPPWKAIRELVYFPEVEAPDGLRTLPLVFVGRIPILRDSLIALLLGRRYALVAAVKDTAQAAYALLAIDDEMTGLGPKRDPVLRHIGRRPEEDRAAGSFVVQRFQEEPDGVRFPNEAALEMGDA